jgi:serine/threonine protein kinase
MEIGKYEILEQVGRGGFGTVYKAKDLSLQRLVAIKVLHANLVNEADFLNRFKQEAQIAAQLEHPNLVSVYDFGENEGRYYLVMAYMVGGSLRDYLAKNGALQVPQARKLIRQVAEGLGYAHNQGLIHRDLKPGNILIDGSGNARICDLGFAKLLNSDNSVSLTTTGGVIGTASYMAPEIWKGEAASTASDVYSLACIFAEMLTNKPLFDGDTTPEIMMRHFQPVSIPPNLPNSIRDLLLKSLDPDPRTRTNVISDFITNLDAATDQELASTKDISIDSTAPIAHPANPPITLKLDNQPTQFSRFRPFSGTAPKGSVIDSIRQPSQMPPSLRMTTGFSQNQPQVFQWKPILPQNADPNDISPVIRHKPLPDADPFHVLTNLTNQDVTATLNQSPSTQPDPQVTPHSKAAKPKSKVPKPKTKAVKPKKAALPDEQTRLRRRYNVCGVLGFLAAVLTVISVILSWDAAWVFTAILLAILFLGTALSKSRILSRFSLVLAIFGIVLWLLTVIYEGILILTYSIMY